MCSRFQEVFNAHVPAVEAEAATTTSLHSDRFAEANRGVWHNKNQPMAN